MHGTPHQHPEVTDAHAHRRLAGWLTLHTRVTQKVQAQQAKSAGTMDISQRHTEVLSADVAALLGWVRCACACASCMCMCQLHVPAACAGNRCQSICLDNRPSDQLQWSMPLQCSQTMPDMTINLHRHWVGLLFEPKPLSKSKSSQSARWISK